MLADKQKRILSCSTLRHMRLQELVHGDIPLSIPEGALPALLLINGIQRKSATVCPDRRALGSVQRSTRLLRRIAGSNASLLTLCDTNSTTVLFGTLAAVQCLLNYCACRDVFS